jgi:uncharacterized membrane protein YqjE
MSLRADERVSVRATDGIVRSGRRMLAIFVGMARTRLSLLAIELMEEKGRLWLMLVLTGLVLVFALMALLMLSLLVVALWEDHRLLAIGGLLVFYVAAISVTLLVLRHKAKQGSPLFAHTLRELAKDAAELKGEIDAEKMEFDLERRRRG